MFTPWNGQSSFFLKIGPSCLERCRIYPCGQCQEKNIYIKKKINVEPTKGSGDRAQKSRTMTKSSALDKWFL